MSAQPYDDRYARWHLPYDTTGAVMVLIGSDHGMDEWLITPMTKDYRVYTLWVQEADGLAIEFIRHPGPEDAPNFPHEQANVVTGSRYVSYEEFHEEENTA